MHYRLIQQMFKQILEPICEAKFHKHSYGFRDKRSTHNALSICCHIADNTHNHYIGDLDNESFFDNVDIHLGVCCWCRKNITYIQKSNVWQFFIRDDNQILNSHVYDG